VRAEPSAQIRTDLLQAYVDNYLTQEVRAEAVVKGLDSFVRFLGVAALANAQVTNVASLARDAAVARQTVIGYFEVLVDTLIGVWLPAWRPRAKVKEVGHPKFYFFDPGVVRALGGRLHDSLESTERGVLLETLVLHELRAHLEVSGGGGQLSYWRTPAGTEVDFVCARGKRVVAIEVKGTSRWRADHARALHDVAPALGAKQSYGVYLGSAVLRDRQVEVLPFLEFARRLSRGEII
jgi:predicted AAA+ superfamily ATPase